MPRKAPLAIASLLAFMLIGLVVAAMSAGGASPVVLGSSAFAGTGGEGWGTAHPAKVYNGGDPSGLIKEIQWTSWGGKTATGYGLGYIFRPHGGYYDRPVLVELRARALGHCGSQPAYTQLAVRVPSKPEATLGPWFLWSEARSLCASRF